MEAQSGAGAVPPPQPPPAQQLLTLDQTEDRIEHLLTLASSVTTALAEVHPDAVGECQSAAKEFFASLRLIYASLMAHIRAHASELHHLTASGAPVTLAALPTNLAPNAPAAAAQAASIAAAAHEYRRNVYLDAQAMQVALEGLDIHKERLLELAQQQQQIQQQTLVGAAIKQEDARTR